MKVKPTQFWVSNSSFSVDTEELLEATIPLARACEIITTLRRALLFTAPILLAEALLFAPTTQTVATLIGQLQKTINRVTWQLHALEDQILRQQLYREQAVAIYVAVEGTVSDYLSTCAQFQQLRCSAGGGLQASSFIADHSFTQSASALPWVSNASVFLGLADGLRRRVGTSVVVAELGLRLPSMVNMQQSTGEEALMHRARIKNLSKLLFDAEVQQSASKVEGVLVGLAALGSKTAPWHAAEVVGKPPQVNRVPGVKEVRTPQSLAGLIQRVGTTQLETEPGYGRIEVLKHSFTSEPGAVSAARTAGGLATGYTWTVVIPGTNSWNPLSKSTQDGLSNVQALQNKDSAQKQAVYEAMEQAGIKPGDPVELVGHSQGGMVAAQLATEEDPRFNVVSVLTAGSPVTGIEKGGGVNMEKMNLLHLEDLRDLVPALDTGYNTVGTTVYALPEVQSPMSPHAVENYQRIAYELDNNASDTVQEWLDRRAELITGGRNPKTVSMQFDLRRE